VFFLGVVFVLIGVLGEAFSGNWFEGFLDPRYPRDLPAWDDEVIKSRLGRLTLCVGVVLAMVGAVAELT
jgi:hypothetical protein